jgi:hypothetical protein
MVDSIVGLPHEPPRRANAARNPQHRPALSPPHLSATQTAPLRRIVPVMTIFRCGAGAAIVPKWGN